MSFSLSAHAAVATSVVVGFCSTIQDEFEQMAKRDITVDDLFPDRGEDDSVVHVETSRMGVETVYSRGTFRDPGGNLCTASSFPDTNWIVDFLSTIGIRTATWTPISVEPIFGSSINYPISSTSWADPLPSTDLSKVGAAYQLVASNLSVLFTNRLVDGVIGGLNGLAPKQDPPVYSLVYSPITQAVHRLFSDEDQKAINGSYMSGLLLTDFFGSDFHLHYDALHEPQRYNPYVGVSSAANPLRQSCFGEGILSRLIGSYFPDCEPSGPFVFPLFWPNTFFYDSLPYTLRAFAMPETFLSEFDELRDSVYAAVSSGSDQLSSLREILLSTSVSLLGDPVVRLAIFLYSILLPHRRRETLEALRAFAENMEASSDGFYTMNQQFAGFLYSIDTLVTELGDIWSLFWGSVELFPVTTEQLFGVSHTGLSDLITALDPGLVERLSGGTPEGNEIPPTVFLTDKYLTFSFEEYSAIDYYGDVPKDLEITYYEWALAASPLIQVAYIVELASMLFQLGICAEGAYFGVLALVENSAGTGGYRSREGDKDLECLHFILSGVSLHRLLGFIWKQTVVDNLLMKWSIEHPSLGLACLYQVFCWMRDSEDRSAVDTVLGTPEEDTEYAGVFLRKGGGVWELLFGGGNDVTIEGLSDRWESLSRTTNVNMYAAWFKFIGVVRSDSVLTKLSDWIYDRESTAGDDLYTGLIEQSRPDNFLSMAGEEMGESTHNLRTVEFILTQSAFVDRENTPELLARSLLTEYRDLVVSERVAEPSIKR